MSATETPYCTGWDICGCNACEEVRAEKLRSGEYIVDSGYVVRKLATPYRAPFMDLQIGDQVEWQRYSKKVQGIIVKKVPHEYTIRWSSDIELPLRYHKYAKVSPHRLTKVA